MRTLTLATTVAALAFAAAPAVAMDNPVQESRAKIERALGHVDAAKPKPVDRAVTASTTLHGEPTLDRYQRAHKRLFKFRSPPAGR